MRNLIAVFICVLSAQISLAQNTGGSIRGRVTDPLGAVVPGALVTLAGAPDGRAGKSVKTDGEGRFAFTNLPPGTYVLRAGAAAAGFAAFEQTDLRLTAGERREIDIQLSVAPGRHEVSVAAAESGLSVSAENNAGAIALRDSEIEILPEDPAELEAALRAMAGVAVGPDGGQILIDGFENTGQPLPPRESIREVRINQNPFSAENDRVGFGQIQIITRPGTEKWAGGAYFNFNDARLNARNPFASERAPHRMKNYGGNLGGAILPKRASFFLNFNRVETDDNAVVNATVLDENLNPVRFSRVVVTPRLQTSIFLRADVQLSPDHTLSARYSFYRLGVKNFGAGGFSLPERAFDLTMPIHTFQLSETAVIGSKLVNEFRLQYVGENRLDDDRNDAPTVNVLGAFAAGGSGTGLARNPEGRLTAQDSVLWTAGKHTLRAGARLRRTTITDVSPDFFNGSFTFGGGLAPALDAGGEVVRGESGQIVLETVTSLERYRRTLFFRRRGLPAAEIRARGGGATQFARGGGDPRATARQVDFGAYVQDDWRVTRTFSLALGLRYEFQTNITRNLNLAPRASFAWVPRFANKDLQKPTTVVRGGFGIFFDRFNENQVLIGNKFSSADYFQFVTTDPRFLDAFPSAPSAEELRLALGAGAQTAWRIGDGLREPYTAQAAVSLERQLPLKTTLATTLLVARTFRALRTRNVNSPVIIRDAAGEIVSGVRPLGDRGDIFQYESTGRFRQTQLMVLLNSRLGAGAAFFANYTLNYARGDTDGVGTFPSDNYDLSSEYGRSSTDVRHTFSAGGTIDLPLGIRLNPLVFASSGRPFNITSGRDTNLDSFFADRPAFASDPTRPGVVFTRFGAFDPTPPAAPGQRTVPRNYGESAGYFSVNLAASRVFKFGRARPPAAGGKPGEKPYNLTVSARAINLFNRTNFASPVGNLSSPFFGQAVSTAGGFGAGSVGNPAAGNRRIELQVRFGF